MQRMRRVFPSLFPSNHHQHYPHPPHQTKKCFIDPCAKRHVCSSPTCAQAPALPQQAPIPSSAPGLDRGVFFTLDLKHSEDPFKSRRSGFDRIIQYRLSSSDWLFGVIDGHGSSASCADYLRKTLPVVVQSLLTTSKIGDQEHHHPEELSILRHAFAVCSKEWDRKSTDDRCGAVALLALVRDNKHCFIANAGDCRAVVSVSDIMSSNGNGTVVNPTFRSVTVPHRTDNPQERLRVLNRGGHIRTVQGVLRVQGVLIPTRVFGDVCVRTDFFGNLQDFVAPEPDCVRVEPKEGRHGKAFLLMASDGLWDTLTDTQVSRIISESLEMNKSAEEICKDLGKKALTMTEDDISIIMLIW